MNNLAEQLATGCRQLPFEVSDQQQQQLLAYLHLLHKWNKAYNLTAVRQVHDMVSRHLLDSLAVRPFLTGERFIDVGTGPGLPGMVLAICMPDQHFVLLDTLGKRVRFMRQVVHELGLTNAEPVQSRVEDYHSKQPFDGVLSRAFAELADMLDWCAHLTNSKGAFYALKGQYPADEIRRLPAAFECVACHALDVPLLPAQRHLLVIKKKADSGV